MVFGAKGLAVAGGVVTVLGIVFFFALAVNRGWIGPGARVVLGAAASTIVFIGGLELRHRRREPDARLLGGVDAPRRRRTRNRRVRVTGWRPTPLSYRHPKEARLSILWIILIIIVVLALLGFFSRGVW
jgi:hypothetical protein